MLRNPFFTGGGVGVHSEMQRLHVESPVSIPGVSSKRYQKEKPLVVSPALSLPAFKVEKEGVGGGENL